MGDWVIACGSPFGLRQTVSAGIISAVGRGNVGIAEYEDFVPTDAAINPGNSGGPLVDLSGRVVGINTAIASASGGNAGVGFAIPIDRAAQVMRQLVDTGKVVRGHIGLYISDIRDGLAESFGYERADIVVNVAGKDVKTASEAQRQLVAVKSPVRVRVMRDGRGMFLMLSARE